jgi:ferredoxin-NADP reductase
MILEFLGYGLIALAVIGVGLVVYRQIKRDRFERDRRALELALLRNRLETERDRRQVRNRSELPWNGYRKFVVKQKVREAAGLASFYLSPHDGKTLPEFMPGQYLTFQLPVPGHSQPVTRCYSLSDRPRPDHFRVTIKRQPAAGDAAGVGSGFFHEHVQEGDILDVKAPSGHFFLDPAEKGGVVLIGGGIGITPLLSMLLTLVAAQARREIWLFYSVRHREDQIMPDALRTIGRENPNVHLVICYSQPRPEDIAGEHYDEAGRISVRLFQRLLPSNNYDYYLCGPGGMMGSLATGLKDWGVPAERIHFETFGASSVKKMGEVGAPVTMPGKTCSVFFKRSGRQAEWTGHNTSLLELAGQSGVAIASGCRAGNCGTCVVAILGGQISYPQLPGFTPEPKTCLACLAMPTEDLVLDA